MVRERLEEAHNSPSVNSLLCPSWALISDSHALDSKMRVLESRRLQSLEATESAVFLLKFFYDLFKFAGLKIWPEAFSKK